MRTTGAQEVIHADILSEGVILDFQDGHIALFPHDLLYAAVLDARWLYEHYGKRAGAIQLLSTPDATDAEPIEDS